MRIHVRYFAAAREATGCEAEALDVGTGTTVEALDRQLRERHPDLDAIRLRYAVGEAFAEGTAVLAEGDEVALIPPVSGG